MRRYLFLLMAAALPALLACGDGFSPTELDAPVAFSGECEGEIVPPECEGGGGGGGQDPRPAPYISSYYLSGSSILGAYVYVSTTSPWWTAIHVNIGQWPGETGGGGVGTENGYGTLTAVTIPLGADNLCPYVDENNILAIKVKVFGENGHTTDIQSGAMFLPNCHYDRDTDSWN